MSMHVSNEDNLRHVIRICQRFLAEKFQLSLDTAALGEFVQDALNTLDPRLDLEEANKAIIVKVKDAVLAKQASMEGQLPPLPQQGSVPASDDDFYKRLQDLETQRSLPPQNLSAAAAKSPIISTTSSSAAPPVGGPSVVYLPATASPSRYHKSVVINGSDRMWEYFTKRSTLVWPGPTQGTSTTLVALLLPKLCAGMTPVVSVEITGAAGNSVETVCILQAGNGSGWDAWVPCGEAAVFKTLACPWTIKLRDNFLRPLDLGEDAIIIKKSVQLQNGNTKIMFEGGSTDMSLCRGTRIRVNPDGSPTHFDTVIINYDNASAAAEIPRRDENLANAKMCNLSMQATLVLSVPTATTQLAQ